MAQTSLERPAAAGVNNGIGEHEIKSIYNNSPALPPHCDNPNQWDGVDQPELQGEVEADPW